MARPKASGTRINFIPVRQTNSLPQIAFAHMNTPKKTTNERIGKLMGRFFDELTSDAASVSNARIDSLVEATLVLLNQTSDGNVSPEFTDFLRYVIKKSGEQKKSENYLRDKHAHNLRIRNAA